MSTAPPRGGAQTPALPTANNATASKTAALTTQTSEHQSASSETATPNDQTSEAQSSTSESQEEEEDDDDDDEASYKTADEGDDKPNDSHFPAVSSTEPKQATQHVKSTNSTKSQAKKRKRSGHGWAKKKSHKPWTPGPPGVHSDNWTFYSRRYYKIRGIIAEREDEYQIRWAGADRRGHPYIDSWVPKGNANKRAVADWERREREGKQQLFYDTEQEEELRKTEKSKKSKKAGGAKAKGKK